MSDSPHENGLAVIDPESEAVSSAQLADLGFIMPLATPSMLRAAFAEKQRMYAAILDETDYIYSVNYVENGRARQGIYARRQDAEKAATTYMTEYRASPKKSGIVKLAAALGIEAKRMVSRGLPEDPSATFSYVTYQATHRRTGRSEEGIGWCDNKERPKLHDIIATADTRAYNRAVLRLAGFGDVSADEIIAGASTDDQPAATVIIDSQPKKPSELPELSSPEVMRSMRAWWEAELGVSRVPAAQQSAMAARELRAKARRGDEAAARTLGSRGFTWDGPASDGIGFEIYQVEAPIPMLRETNKIEEPKAEEPKKGWNLSGAGSENDDTAPMRSSQAPRPQVDTSEVITVVQAKNLSEMLMRKFGSKEAAREWLQKHANVDRSVNVRSSQYESIMSKLEKEV
jgi:hypothetical protein